MIIAVSLDDRVPVEPAARRDIDLAAHDGLYPLFRRFLVEVDAAVHDTVVRDGSAVHSQLFDLRYVFFNFVGAIEKRILRMYM